MKRLGRVGVVEILIRFKQNERNLVKENQPVWEGFMNIFEQKIKLDSQHSNPNSLHISVKKKQAANTAKNNIEKLIERKKVRTREK